MSAPVNFGPGDVMQRYHLPNEEVISCIYWNNVFYITGTDIVRCLHYRFEAFGRVVRNKKKFEEGVFSDLRALKCNSDAILEEPKSKFLDFLYKHSCVRTQKKQKVFHWYSVSHDNLFLDALERDLKREAAGKRASTEAIGEPALSFKYDASQSLSDQLTQIIDGIPKPLAAIADASTSNNLVSQYSHAAASVAQQQQAAVAAAAAINPSASSFPGHGDPSMMMAAKLAHSYANVPQPSNPHLHHSIQQVPPDDLDVPASSKFLSAASYEEPNSVGLLDVTGAASYAYPQQDEAQYIKQEIDSDFPLDYFPAENNMSFGNQLQYDQALASQKNGQYADFNGVSSSSNEAGIARPERSYSVKQMQYPEVRQPSSDYVVYVNNAGQQLVSQNGIHHRQPSMPNTVMVDGGDFQDSLGSSSKYIANADISSPYAVRQEASNNNVLYGLDYNDVIAANGGIKRMRKAPGYMTDPMITQNRIAKSMPINKNQVLKPGFRRGMTGASNVGLGLSMSDAKHYYPTPSDSGSTDQPFIMEANDDLKNTGIATQYVYIGGNNVAEPVVNFDEWTN